MSRVTLFCNYLLTQDQAVQTTLGAVVTEASAGFTGPEEETELATEPSPAFVPQQEELLLGNTFTIFSCLWSHQLYPLPLYSHSFHSLAVNAKDNRIGHEILTLIFSFHYV